jgi:flagellar biosynthesis GTPase FlhF
MEITAPQKRGATTRAIGSTAIISIAAICSVAFIRPISAVMAEPARLANNSAATTGPNSRTSDSDTSTPKRLLGAIGLQCLVALQPQNHTDKQPRHQNDDQRQNASRKDFTNDQMKAAEAGPGMQQYQQEEARRHPHAPDSVHRAAADAAQRRQQSIDHAANPRSNA